MVIINPIQNSNPASANKKKDVVVKTKSSLITPKTTVMQYKITQTISENNIICSNPLQLIKNKNSTTQNKSIK